MEEIKRQVSRARRRLITEQFFGVFAWSMFLCLVVALIAIAVPKIWHVGVGGEAWTYGWLAGAAGVGVLLSLVWTFAIRRGELEAAIEIDRRFGLKERVSSSLALAPAELDSEAGRALMEDAQRRIARLEMSEQFRLRPDFRPFLAMIPALIAGGLLFLDDASMREAKAKGETPEIVENKVKTATETLQQKLAEKQRKAAEEGLKEAEAIFDRLTEGLDKLQSDNDVDRRKALVQISELTKDLEKRRQELGGTDKLKQQLSQMKNMQNGPADKVAQAIKDGDFSKAVEALKEMSDKLAKGEMTEKEQKELAQQLNQMKQKLQQMADAHQQAKQDLQQQIEQRMKAGDLAGAGRLQQKLDQMNMQNKQMEQLQQMAAQMDQAQQALQQGKGQQAAQQMQQMAQQMQQMQNELDELETINEAMNEIADAKNAMNCKQCNGQGCQECQGNMMGSGMGNNSNRNGPPGQGMGPGQGRGDRPEEATDTGTYSTKVRQNMEKGEVIRTGDANGPNLAGQSREAVKEEILGSKSEAGDPIVNERLPRTQREHLQQYFERFTDDF